MKRLLAMLTATVLIGLGAAAPALADDTRSDVTCTSTAHDGYKQVLCVDADGVTVSDTTYYENGCVTTIDADGNESTSCPEVDPWIDPWNGGYPNDISCDVEALIDDSGATTKVVICRNTDGDIVSASYYSEDGCVTEVDAAGNESTTCPGDGDGSDEGCVTSTDVDGNESITCPDDGDGFGCFTQTDADGNEVVVCVDPPVLGDITCEGEPAVDANGVEYKFVTCRSADGTVVSQTRYFPDGCVTEVDAAGNESTYCPSPNDCSLSVDADGNQRGDCGWGKPWLDLGADTQVTSVGELVDGCRVITLSDGKELKACTDPDAPANSEPLRLDDRGCVVTADSDGTVWSVQCPGACTFSSYTSDDGAASESAYCETGSTPTEQNIVAGALCDFEQLLVDGQIVVLATCDDGCVQLNGTANDKCVGTFFSVGIGPRTGMHVARAGSWDERSCWERNGASDWQGVDCPKVLYDYMNASVDGGIMYKSGRGNGLHELFAVGAAGPDAGTAASGSPDGITSGSPEGVAPAVITPAPALTDKTRTIALAAGNTTPAAPMSPAVAAVAVAAAGAAGAASIAVRRVRVPVRRR